MKQSTNLRIIRPLGLIVLLIFLAQVSTGQVKRGMTGDWQLQIDVDAQHLPAILSLSRNGDGTLKGEWLSFWSITPLREIKYENKQLTFAMTIRLDQGDTDTTFSGSVNQGELSGIFKNSMGEYPCRGKRIKRISRAAGTWQTNLRLGEREFTADIIIKVDAQGKLSADWKSQYDEHEITNVQFNQGKLTFDLKSRIQDRQWESNFEGTIKGHTLSGTAKSDRGNITMEGIRVGATVIGQWELDVKSDSRNRKELLRIFPDMSARYGAISIEKVHLDDKGVTFKTTHEIDNLKFDISFTSQITGRKLTGEITSLMGTAEVTGEKRRMARASRQNPRGG